MRTRVNTKFVIILCSVLVLLVGGFVGLLAVKGSSVFGFLRDAEDYAEIGEEAIAEAKVSLKAGNVEEYNNKLERGKRNYGAAHKEDPSNSEYLMRYIDIERMKIVDDLTLAYNNLNTILQVMVKIHDNPNATLEERRAYYELLHDRLRADLVVDGRRASNEIYGKSRDWLVNHPDDELATYYLALVETGNAGSDKTTDQQRQEILENLNQAITASPDDPWLRNAAGRYHASNARRIYRVNGNSFTEEVNATNYRAFEELQRAVERAGDDPAPLIQALELMLSIRAQDKEMQLEIIGEQIEVARKLHEMLQQKEMRDKLFAAELNRAIWFIQGRGSGIADHPFDGFAYSQELAEAVVEDRPQDPSAHAMLGTLYWQRGEQEKAEKAVARGLKVLEENDRPNGREFVLAVQARLEMLSTQAEVMIFLAEQAKQDDDNRLYKQRLVEAANLLKKLNEAPAPSKAWRDARVQFLRGRIDFAYRRYKEAVARFDKANELYKRIDTQKLQMLNYLARAHAQLKNDKAVIDTYEQIVQIQPTSPQRLALIQVYLNQSGDQGLNKAEFHLNNYLSQFPNNLMAIRFKAGLMARREQPEQAIELLQALLEENPELNETNPEIKGDIENYLQMAGQVDEAIKRVRQRIADRPEGTQMNLQLVNRLLSMLAREEKLTEIDRLESQGLNARTADILRKLTTNGRLTLQDELAFNKSQGFPPGQHEIREYMIYRRWGKTEQARASLEEAARLAPDLPAVLEARFITALSEERWDDAELVIRDALDLDLANRPDIAVADGAFMRAQVTAMKGLAMNRGPARDKMLLDATVDYRQALDKYEFYVNGWVQLARVYLAQNNYFAAQDALREALGLQSQNVAAMELMAQAEIATDNEARALERYEQILSINPNHPTALDRFTALSQQLGVPGRAITLRERIRDRVPDNTGNRRALALLYAGDKAYERARDEIDAIIDREGRTQPNMIVLARVLAQGEKSDQAIQEVKQYLDQRGDNADWRDYLLLAQTYQWADDRENADRAFAKAMELENKQTADATLAWAATLQERGELERAAAIYKRLSDERPENEQLKIQTLQVLLNAKLYDQAEKLAMTLGDTPERYRALVNIALGKGGQLALAVQRARAGVKAFPNDLNLRLQLARLLLTIQNRRPADSRQFDEVRKLAEQLLSDQPDRVEAQLLMADVHLAMDNKRQAVGQLEQILEFAPSHVQANERLYTIKVAEAQQLAQTSVEASEAKAAEALGIAALLIKDRPDLPLLHRRAGEAATLAGLDEQAVEHYRNAFDKTNAAQDLAAYATALLTIDRGADARTVLDNPENATMISNNLYLRALRGRALVMSGEADNGAFMLTNVLKAADEVQAQLVVVQQITRAFKDDPDRALKTVTDVLGEDLPVAIDASLAGFLIREDEHAKAANRLAKFEVEPVNDTLQQFNLLMQLGVARQEAGQLDAAKRTYENAYKLVKQNPNAIPMRLRVHLLNNTAYLLADKMTGYEQEAIKYAREALEQLSSNEQDENVALIEDTLGWALCQAGQYEEAIKVLNRSVDKYELSANLLHLGIAYNRSGKKDVALDVLDRARRRAKADGDEKMIEATEKAYRDAL
jgi:tetratricopeptide (TPR) repeat protein